MRESIFSTKLVAVGEFGDDEKICKLFAIYVPISSPRLLCLTVAYTETDEDFIKQSITIMEGIFENKYTKIKAYIMGDDDAQKKVAILEAIGFEKEAEARNDAVRISTYSYFY
ncbi:MAG: hypothetical protein FWG41_00475 [Methanomassiliicoccaceae archaeon]|nr:hypothetical protein [Methanomassiliicoccaceae archaeon]